MDMEGTPSESLAEAFQALAMLGLSEGGGTLSVDQTIAGRPDLETRIAKLDPVIAAATFGGMLTAPGLQANACRIEALVHLALAVGRGTQKPSDKLVESLFRQSGHGPCGYMEDPAEDMFLGAVRTPWGNFRVLEGLWEGSTFHMQRFVDVIASMPSDDSYDHIRRPVLALLRLSDAICERAKLTRWQLGEEMPLDALPRRMLTTLMMRRRHLRFTDSDLRVIGIEPQDLAPFVFDMNAARVLREQALGSSDLERRPLVVRQDVLHVVLPTAITSAARYFVVENLEGAGMLGSLLNALAVSYSELFEETPLLGGSRPPDLQFRPTEDGAFAETIMSVDAGRFIHFLFYTDALTDLNRTGLAGVNPTSSSIGPMLSRRIAAAREALMKRSEFRAGLTIIVGCGIGRGAAVVLDRHDWPDWRTEYCSAYDLMTLSYTPEFKPTKLWRILDGRDLLVGLGVHLQNLNGLLNLVAWSQALDGHLVPHGRLPDEFASDGGATLAIDQNRQLNLRHEVALANDPQVARFVDGQVLRIRKDSPSIFPDDRVAPLYASEDPGPSGFPMMAFMAPRRIWWADVHSPADAGRPMAYERWRLVGTWLSRSASVLDSLHGLPVGPLLWEARFESSQIARPAPMSLSTYEEARSAVRVEVDRDRGVITTVAGEGFELAQFHVENIAERALVAALVHGAALLAEQYEPERAEDELTPLIVINTHARHGHAFMQRGFRDMIRPALSGRTVMIGRDDDAFVRLGLGWSVRERSAGGRIQGSEDCRSFLNDLVRHIEDDIVSDLRSFKREAMLSRLLRNHELAIFDRDLWRRTSSAMIGLHGDGQDTIDVITEHEFKLSAVFQTTRVLIEIAICECPLEDGHNVAALDLSLLMAKASLLVQIGGWSDAMRWGLMRPELRVTPLGDVHANFDFLDEIIFPHGRLMSEGRVTEAVESYADNLKERPFSPTVESGLDPLFVEAWTEQFGGSIDETRLLIDFIENIGVESGQAIISIPSSQLRNIKVGDRPLENVVADRLVDTLTFRTRSSWRELPEGFEDRERQPWRYRRQLSFLRRPLLQPEEGSDPMILFVPGAVRDAFSYMIGNFFRGDFPDHQLSPKMKKWRAKTTGERGTIFANMVAEALVRAGWETRVEFNVTALLRRGFERDYGDIDVLAWRADTGRVLIIECKDVQFRKTYGEIAEQLADFCGETRTNGKRDELRKHLDRMDVIRQHLEAVSAFTGIHPLADVESHLMFRNPVPMEFALEKMAEKVVVSRFDLIADI